MDGCGSHSHISAILGLVYQGVSPAWGPPSTPGRLVSKFQESPVLNYTRAGATTPGWFCSNVGSVRENFTRLSPSPRVSGESVVKTTSSTRGR